MFDTLEQHINLALQWVASNEPSALDRLFAYDRVFHRIPVNLQGLATVQVVMGRSFAWATGNLDVRFVGALAHRLSEEEVPFEIVWTGPTAQDVMVSANCRQHYFDQLLNEVYGGFVYTYTPGHIREFAWSALQISLDDDQCGRILENLVEGGAYARKLDGQTVAAIRTIITKELA